jgi:hypothetical protein
MPSIYVANDAASYERSMAWWSRRLAARFIDFAAIGSAARLVDVGCGTGSLTFARADASARGDDHRHRSLGRLLAMVIIMITAARERTLMACQAFGCTGSTRM